MWGSVPLPFFNTCLCVSLLAHLLMWKDAPASNNIINIVVAAVVVVIIITIVILIHPHHSLRLQWDCNTNNLKLKLQWRIKKLAYYCTKPSTLHLLVWRRCYHIILMLDGSMLGLWIRYINSINLHDKLVWFFAVNIVGFSLRADELWGSRHPSSKVKLQNSENNCHPYSFHIFHLSQDLRYEYFHIHSTLLTWIHA